MTTVKVMITIMIMVTAMLHKPEFTKLSEAVSPAALYRLMAWFSPAYPVGAYSYSSGIEWAVEAGDISNAQTLQRWLKVMLGMGGGFCDGVFLVHSHRAISENNDNLLCNVADLAAAFAPSKERFVETTAQGRAFLETMQAAWPCAALNRLQKVWDGPLAYPVVVGAASAGHEIPVAPVVHAYLQAFVANLVSAGVRLIPLGQTAGQRMIANLEQDIAATTDRALIANLDDVGTSAFRVDMASMRHETQYTRLFRS